jgi:hypothetical protein
MQFRAFKRIDAKIVIPNPTNKFLPKKKEDADNV